MNKPVTQASSSGTSILRPRNARLISYLEDGDGDEGPSNPRSDLFSPIDHGVGLSDSQPLERKKSIPKGPPAARPKDRQPRSVSDSTSPTASSSFWSSWTSMQEIASTLLGSDVSQQHKGKRKGAPNPIIRHNDSVRKQATTWGPAPEIPSSKLHPSVEERTSILQSKKRETVLAASVNEGRDILGRYKRRDSTSDVFYNENEQGEDSLVYVHKIQTHDTLAGVSIRYGCPAEIFRKVNRFWPNDNIQTRNQVLLPVDSCSVRSKKMNDLELLSTELESVAANAPPQILDGQTSPNNEAPPIVLAASPTAMIEDSRHESWVLISGFPNPVEVLRLPRRAMGYFPPARRKSITVIASNTSTPKTSLDMLRHPPTHAASQNASPVRRAQMNYQLSRQRSSSTTTGAIPSFVDHLQGPGGVGMLHGLRTQPARPGPGPDSLNTKFAQYLPALAPPEAVPRTSLRPTPRGTPRASTDSIRSNSSATLGDVPGAIEGWVRKMATNTKNGKASAKMGDLIELETNSESGDLLGDDGEQTPTQATTRYVHNTASQASEEDLLDERFPMRGRVRNAYEGKSK